MEGLKPKDKKSEHDSSFEDVEEEKGFIEQL
jgi:hypothetical protein